MALGPIHCDRVHVPSPDYPGLSAMPLISRYAEMGFREVPLNFLSPVTVGADSTLDWVHCFI